MRIAYLATGYPFVSHTFIQGEVLTLPDHGIEVLPIALNPPVDADLLTDVDAAEAQRTFYVKGMAPLVVLTTVLSIAARHPAAVAAGSVRAMAWGRWNLALGLKLLAQFIEGLLVWQHCRRHEVSAIHAHFGQAPSTVALFAARFGSATSDEPWTWSATIHGWHEFVDEETARLRDKVTDADLVVCVSEYTRAQLMRIAPTPVHWTKLHVVRCGIDLHAFAFRPAPPTGPTGRVVVIARLSPEKGHAVLLEAIARMAGRCAVDVEVIGDGPSTDDLRRAAERLGIADRTHFSGPLPPAAVAEALGRADVFCLPTFAEGLPVSIMEAMAVGVPVVTTFISGIPELVVNGSTGWVVPAGSVDSLVGALEAALTSIERPDIVSAARAAVERAHDRTKTVAELADLFTRYHRLSTP